MRIQKTIVLSGGLLLAVGFVLTGCGTGIFNPAFVNSQLGGGVVPQTPGPEADYVLVRLVNTTGQPVEFIVTIDRDVLDLDDDGNPQRDEDGNLLTVPQRESVRLQTAATGNASESGTLFECAKSRITRVGLGENLLSTDVGAFVGGAGAGGAAGFGVPVGQLNPLQLSAGNFNCGDTIIFRAIVVSGQAGGVGLQSFLLPGYEQPSEFSGPNTFVNLQNFIETQVGEDD